MIVKLKFPFLRFVTERARMEVLQRIADLVEVEGRLLVLAEGSQRTVSKEIKELPEARVFSRKDWNPA